MNGHNKSSKLNNAIKLERAAIAESKMGVRKRIINNKYKASKLAIVCIP